MSAAVTPSADVLIVGAGPAGLALACALADQGLRSLVLEQQNLAALADPADDGREIALTHRARQILLDLGIWQRFAPGAGEDAVVSPIRAARVLNGRSTASALGFDPGASGCDALGYLVPNHLIRRSAYAAAAQRAEAIQLHAGARVRSVTIRPGQAQVELDDGTLLSAPLLVAADSRFSQTRRQLGVGAQMRDFGRSVIVCRLTHERAHEGVAYECFGYGSTLAMLPLRGRQVSAVVTVPSQAADELLRMSPAAYAAMIQDRFGSRLGNMQLPGKRHAYPLVAVHADRFAGPRFALIGDAAVGMHPVTAHGFNLGLYGVQRLAARLAAARAQHTDIGDLRVLGAFAAEQRRETWPLFHGTNALVGLFTDDRAPARLLRAAVLRVSARLPPLRSAITQRLIDVPRRAQRPGISTTHPGARP